MGDKVDLGKGKMMLSDYILDFIASFIDRKGLCKGDKGIGCLMVIFISVVFLISPIVMVEELIKWIRSKSNADE